MTTPNNKTQVGFKVAKTAGLKGLNLVEGDAAPVITYGPDLRAIALRLGEVVSRLDLFRHNEKLVFFRYDGTRQEMTGKIFRTWINEHVVIARKYDKDTGAAEASTLSEHDASAILVSDDFLRGVRIIKHINTVRLPVMRNGQDLELLPEGYDEESMCYTRTGSIDYPTDMDIASARGWITRIYDKFPFQDQRSVAVQIAALLVFYIKHLPGGDGLKPGIIWLANKSGSGKSVLAKSSLAPVFGLVYGQQLASTEELNKVLEAKARAGAPYIFFDNVKGTIESSSLELFMTSHGSAGRAMGGHDTFEVIKDTVIIVTGNDLELKDDTQRRFLIVDIFEKGDPANRDVKDEDILDEVKMATEDWRKNMLSICWAFVRNWHEAGCPKSLFRIGSFESFTQLLGGIVEAAGYDPPCQKAEIPDCINPENQQFQQLVEAAVAEMGDAMSKDFTSAELCRIARSIGVLEEKVGTSEEGRKLAMKDMPPMGAAPAVDTGVMDKKQQSAFGILLKRKGGQHFSVNGRTVEFGSREKRRNSTRTLKIL